MHCRCFVSLAAFVCLGMAASLGAGGQENPPAGKNMLHKLPDDPKAAVVSLDYRGGFTPPRLNASPTLSILADGTVLIPANYQGQKAFEGKLDAKELQGLLDFILVKNEFFEYDAKAVQAKLNKGGPRIAIADAATVVVRVEADGKKKEVSHYALGFGGQDVKELTQLNAIKGRLEQIRSVIQLGGREKLAKWLDLANRELKAAHPDAKLLSAEDLQSGGERADASVYINFSRTVADPDANPPQATITTAFINQPAQGEPKVTVSHRAGPQ